SRRGLLARAFALFAGAAGIQAAGAGAATLPSRTLVLHGRGFHLDAPSRKPGTPVSGDRATAYGELLAGGRGVGHFVSAYVAFDSPFAGSGALELQTFHLADGAIHGTGSSSGGEGRFAVVGGTGSYAGATGSYVAVQRLRDLGGDGTAEFHLTLVNGGVS